MPSEALSESFVELLLPLVEESISPTLTSALSDALVGPLSVLLEKSVEESISTGVSDSSEVLALSISPLLHPIKMSEQMAANSTMMDLFT